MISVIILTYNRINQLLSCLDLLYNQGFDDFETIIIDNGSTDNTVEIIRNSEFQNCKIIENKSKTNFAHSRNLGLTIASGDKIAFIDDDCLPQPGWLKKIDDNLNLYDAVGGLVLPSEKLVFPDWWHPEMGWIIGVSNPGHSGNLAGIVYYPQTANMAIKKNILIKENFQDIKGDFKDGKFVYFTGREDAELWRRLRVNGYKTFFDKEMIVRHDIPQSRLDWNYLKQRAYTDGITFFIREGKKEYIYTALYEIYSFPRIMLKNFLFKSEQQYGNARYKYLWTLRQFGFVKGYFSNKSKFYTYYFITNHFIHLFWNSIKNIIKPTARNTASSFYRFLRKNKKLNFNIKIKNKSKIQNIIFYALGFLGDMVVTIPALRAIKKTYPNAFITLVCFENGKLLYDSDNLSDEIICLKKYDNNDIRLIESLERINVRKYDIGLAAYLHDVHPNIFFKANIDYRIGYDKDLGFNRNLWYDMLDAKVVKEDSINEIENIFKLLSFIDIKIKPEQYNLKYSQNEITNFEEFSKKYNLYGDNLIALHTGAIGKHKRWDNTNWIELINKIKTSYNYKFIFIGSKEERDNADIIASESNADYINLCGETTPRRLGLVLKKCAALITTDSGPKHIAFISDTPTITLYVADVIRWKAYWNSEKHKIVEVENLNLTYEEKIGLPENHFISWIKPERVFNELKNLINEKTVKG